MNIEKIHKTLLTSKFLLAIIVFAFIAVRLHDAGSQWNDPYLWGNLLIQIGTAFFLLQINYVFNIIQQRTFLPASFYLLFIGGNPAFYYDLEGSAATLLVILAYYFLFHTYQKPNSQINALNISLLLVLGSLFWAPLLFFFPLIWRGFYRFHCFNLRVFLASLTGFVIVYLIIFTFSIFMDDQSIFLSLLPRWNELFAVQKTELSIAEWIIAGFLLFNYILIGINLFLFNTISERVWTISILTYLYFSSFVIFILFLLQSEYKSCWGMIIFIPVAMMTAYFYSRSNKKIIHYLLLFFFFFFIGINIWQRIGS